MKRVFLYLGLLLIAILPLLISSKLLYLKDPPIWPDEAVFYSMSINIFTQKVIPFDIYGNFLPSLPNANLGYPPIFFYLLSFWINLFGTTIEIFRSLSLVLAFFSLIAFYFLIKKLLHSNILAFLGIFLLSANVFFSRSSRIGRMEILVFLLSLLSYLLLIKGLREGKTLMFLGAGMLSALAILTHQMGAFIIIILCCYILFDNIPLKKKLVNIFKIILPFFLLILCWLVSLGDKITYYIISIQNQIINKNNTNFFGLVLFKTDFSWWIFFTISIIVLLLLLGIFLLKRNSISLFLFIGTLITLLFTIIGKEGNYLIYIQPFIIINNSLSTKIE